MQLSVIILNYKVPYYLLSCLNSVSKSTASLDAEIIVVDNHSEDESCALVKKHFPKVRLLASSTNDGFSRGNNKGVAMAKGRYICLLNPDTLVGEHTFTQLLSFMEDHPDAGIVGPQLIDGRGAFLPESKRNIPTPGIALKKMLGKAAHYYASIPQNETGKVAVLAGAFMLMRKDRYEKAGKLDEDYFMYGEDIDLSYKFLKSGYQNYYVGETVVLHYKGESTAKNKVYRKRFYQAMRIFYKKHFKKNSLSLPVVDLGLYLAKISHSLRQKKTPPSPPVHRHIWIGKANPSARKWEKNMGIRFDIISPKGVEKEYFKDTMFIFDGAEVSYTKILTTLQRQQNGHNKFRLKPKSFDFLIGSDTSSGQGKIIFDSPPSNKKPS